MNFLKHSVLELERAFSQSFGFPEVVWFPYARVAQCAFLEVSAGPNRRTVLSPFNGAATGAAVRAAGCFPLYVDTESGGYREDRSAFELALARDGVGAGIAIAPVGLLSHDYAVPKPVLYDYALAGLNATRPSLKPGDGVVYSMSPGKPLSVLRGGFLCGLDSQTASRWRTWRASKLVEGQSGKDFRQWLALSLGYYADKAAPVGFPKDWNECLSAWAYALCLRKLGQRERLAKERLEQVRLYDEALREYAGEGVTLPPVGVLSHYPIRVADPFGLRARLLSRGLSPRPPVVAQLLCDYPELSGEAFGSLANARELCRRTLHLPLEFGMSASAQRSVAKEVGHWVRERGTEAPGVFPLGVQA